MGAVADVEGTRVPRLDSLWIAAAALLVYWLLRQGSLYGPDGPWMLIHGKAGAMMHPHHFLYLPLVALYRQVGDPLGLTVFQIEGWVSATTTAAAVGLAHRAGAWLGLERRAAAGAAALFAGAPAVVFYATVVELHGPFLMVAATSFLALAATVRRPTVGRAACLGLCTGLSVGAHATGHLLPLMAWPLLVGWTWGRATWQRMVTLGAVLAVVHWAIAWLLPQVLVAAGFFIGTDKQWRHLMHFAADYLPRIWLMGVTVWLDWLRPFFPLALLALLPLVAARWRSQRPAALALLVALVPFLLVTYILMGTRTERGAYMLPLAWPAAVIAVRVLGRGWIVALAMSLAVATIEVRAHDHPEWGRAWASGFVAVHGDAPAYVIVGSNDEVAACYIELPSVDCHLPLDWGEMPAELVPHGLPGLERFLEMMRDAGKTIYLTAGGEAYLQNPNMTPTGEGGPPILAHLLQRYRWEDVSAGSFRGRRLVW